MSTAHALSCMHRLMEAETLLDGGRVEDAASIVASARTELVVDDEELTAPLSMAFMLLEKVEKRLAGLLDDKAGDADCPMPAAQDASTCRRCRASYDSARFMALAPPANGEGQWTLGGVTLAIRQCGAPDCNNTLVRRIA